MPKGTTPIKTSELHSKLSSIWNLKKAWTISPLGKGFYCLRFSDGVDQHIAWTGGQKNLKPGTFKLSPWVQDFVPEKLKQTNAQVWVRLHSIPWEYWDEELLLSIGKTIGIPLDVDHASLRRDLCLYCRVQIDVDLQFPLPPKVLVERDGFSFEVNVSYEKLPDFCTHCSTVGHFVGDCRILKRVQEETTKANEAKDNRIKPQPRKRQHFGLKHNAVAAPFLPTTKANQPSAPPVTINTNTIVDHHSTNSTLNAVFGDSSPTSYHCSPIINVDPALNAAVTTSSTHTINANNHSQQHSPHIHVQPINPSPNTTVHSHQNKSPLSSEGTFVTSSMPTNDHHNSEQNHDITTSPRNHKISSRAH